METEETLVKNVSRRKLPEDNKGRRRRRLGSQKTQQRHLSVWVNQRNRPIAAGISLYSAWSTEGACLSRGWVDVMHPQCSWVMLIGISAHCAKLTQDIPGPALPDSTRRTVKFCRMFSSFPQGSGKMQGTENESQREVKPIKKRKREYFFQKDQKTRLLC